MHDSRSVTPFGSQADSRSSLGFGYDDEYEEDEESYDATPREPLPMQYME